MHKIKIHNYGNRCLLGTCGTVFDLLSFSRLILPPEVLDVVKGLVRTVRIVFPVMSVSYCNASNFSRNRSIKGLFI